MQEHDLLKTKTARRNLLIRGINGHERSHLNIEEARYIK